VFLAEVNLHMSGRNFNALLVVRRADRYLQAEGSLLAKRKFDHNRQF
jgi:hypothetical protein